MGVTLHLSAALAATTGNMAYVGIGLTDASQLAPVSPFPESGTQGIRLNFTGTYGIGIDATMSLQFDSYGASELQLTFGKATSIPSVSLTGGVVYTNADSVDCLHGAGASAGVSGGEGLSGELNFVFSKSYKGVDIGLGGGVSLSPVTPQTTATYTWSLCKFTTRSDN